MRSYCANSSATQLGQSRDAIAGYVRLKQVHRILKTLGPSRSYAIWKRNRTFLGSKPWFSCGRDFVASLRRGPKGSRSAGNWIREKENPYRVDLRYQREISSEVYFFESLVLQCADREFPILLSYVEVVLAGYFSTFGTEGLQRFYDSTLGWDSYILDDRKSPIYPRYFEPPKEVLLLKRRRFRLSKMSANCFDQYRHYSNLRFLMIPIFLSAAGGLFSANGLCLGHSCGFIKNAHKH